MQSFFPLAYQFQNYAWGKIGNDSLVHNLAQKAGVITEDKPEEPYAELWMGDHPSLPSYVKQAEGDKVTLESLISQNPERYLGKAYAQFGKKKLPFLFKVLSVKKILSLQVHPTKELAKELNERQPDVYKDDNHKPEIAIALSQFHALCNFRPYEEIVETFREVDVLREFIGQEIVEKFSTCAPEERPERLKDVIKEFLNKDQETIKAAITKLVNQVSAKQDKTPRDRLVLKLQEEFPFDIGVLMSFVLNYVIAEPGEAFIMDPCEPHAYVFGNCIEVMAASDNVIRGCLTPKYIDKETLYKALSYKMTYPTIHKGERLYTHDKDGFEAVKYPTSYEEFCCYKVEVGKHKETSDFTYQHPSIAIALKGEGTVLVKAKNDSEYKSHKIKEGESLFFLPDTDIKFSTDSEDLVVYISTSQSL